MIVALCRVFVCLAIGDLLARISPWAFPGPVLGFLLLFVDLCRMGAVPEALGTIADRMLQAFGLFFVPAGVGVVAYTQNIRADYLAITLALLVGTLVTIAVTAVGATCLVGLMTNLRSKASWTRKQRQPG